ncbi:MAG: hypothetical protein J6P16_00210 [Eubacterium sp.]|nr:hypothetical protein [Eubacterium sp.]
MGKGAPIDVICQHSRDGTIVPLKIRIRDEDGEYQAYTIQGFREEERMGGITSVDGRYMNTHISAYTCQIRSFGMKRTIRLYYDEESRIWEIGQ